MIKEIEIENHLQNGDTVKISQREGRFIIIDIGDDKWSASAIIDPDDIIKAYSALKGEE